MSSPRTSPFTSVRYAERRRGRSTARIVVWLVVVAVVVAALGVAALWGYAAVTLSGVPVTELARLDDEAQNTLVVTRQENGSAGSIAVVQTSPLHERPRVVVFPVDLRVQVLGEGTQRLGTFLEDGGVALLVDAVQRFTDDGAGDIIALDHYVMVDLVRFDELVTELGGVPDCAVPGDELCGRLSPDAVSAALSPTGTPADDDPARVTEVHGILRNAAAELQSATAPWRPFRTKRLIDAYVAAIETDRDLGPGSFEELASGIVQTPSDGIDVRVVPGTREGDAVKAAPEESQNLFAAFRDPSQPLPEGAGVEAPAELTEADVAVKVLNGEGTAGLAGEVADFLTDKGFTITETDNADAFDPRRSTEIAHGPEGLEKAELVGGYFPDATLREVSPEVLGGADVIVTVGGDWSRA